MLDCVSPVNKEAKNFKETKIFKEEASLCIEWCKYAKECVGEEKYETYKNKKEKIKKKFKR